MSETGKHRARTARFCTGNGVDIGSGGDPVVGHAIQIELPLDAFLQYRAGQPSPTPIQWHGDGLNLPFKDGTLDFAYSSHLLEDFLNWMPALQEWTRVLKPGGKLVLLIPDAVRFAEAIARGQQPNFAHQHEGSVGELSAYSTALGIRVLVDEFAAPDDPEDYSILFVAEKI